MKTRNSIRIGTRGSALALAQTSEVEALLRRGHPDLGIELVTIRTGGDKNQTSPIAQIGGSNVFVREIEKALLQKEIDMAVHSLKDLPSALPPELCIAGVVPRADPRDVFISSSGTRLEALEPGARVGTSSLRRGAQMRRYRPDLHIVPMRGSVETRLRKLDSGECEALILAAAGLLRLDLEERITQYLPIKDFVPSGGQGIIAMELRCDDKELMGLAGAVGDRRTLAQSVGEREFLHVLQGGCHTPVGCISDTTDTGAYRITGFVADLEGKRCIEHRVVRSQGKEREAGRLCAEAILKQGGREILEAVENGQ